MLKDINLKLVIDNKLFLSDFLCKRASPNCPKLAASSPDVPEARAALRSRPRLRMDGSNTVASASYREPRPHARSAAARQEKTRGRRRISRKAPDPSHDAVRTGAESDGRLHTGTTTPEGHSGPSMGKGQLGPFAQSSPPGSHWGICGVVEDYSIAGIQLGTGGGPVGSPGTVHQPYTIIFSIREK